MKIVSNFTEYVEKELGYPIRFKLTEAARASKPIISESLWWYSYKKFEKQLRLEFPRIDEYITAEEDIYNGPEFKETRYYGKNFNKVVYDNRQLEMVASRSCVFIEVKNYYKDCCDGDFEEYKKRLEECIEKFSYYVARKEENRWYACPNRSMVITDLSSKRFLHISRLNDLEERGIRPKSSGRFEDSEPRIYLFDVTEFFNKEKSYETIKKEFAWVSDTFNKTYIRNNTVKEPETYYGYIVRLKEGTELYNDVMFDVQAYYITIPIIETPDYDCITPLGKI